MVMYYSLLICSITFQDNFWVVLNKDPNHNL